MVFPNFFWLLFTFILCIFSVRTLRYFQKNLNQFFVHKIHKEKGLKTAGMNIKQNIQCYSLIANQNSPKFPNFKILIFIVFNIPYARHYKPRLLYNIYRLWSLLNFEKRSGHLQTFEQYEHFKYFIGISIFPFSNISS